MSNPLVIIPARMASHRLPGKPLADIAGRPMIARVVARALEAAIGAVVVATDSPDIARAAEAAGATVVFTRADHPSGTDRIAEALATIDPSGRHDVIVNLQGDEPEITTRVLRAVLGPLDDPRADMATLAAPLTREDFADPNAVKLTGRGPARDRIAVSAFSRLPFEPAAPMWHHIGVYAFRRATLERFVALPPSPNETRERLEQWRALEAGMRIVAALVSEAPRSVDTPADLAAVRARFAAGGSR